MTIYSRAAQSLVLVGALILAGCSSTPEPEQNQMYRVKKHAPHVRAKPPVQAPKISKARLDAIKAFGLDVDPLPSKLVGMSYFDVKRVLGKPNFIRKDEGVEIWQYRHQKCILDLFLYETEDDFQVDHSELRGPRLDSNGELSCFKQIVMGQS